MWATLSTDDLPRCWLLPEMDQAGARNSTPMTQRGSSAELRRGGEPEVESATRKDQGTRTLAEEGLITKFVGLKFVVRQEGGRGIEVKGGF